MVLAVMDMGISTSARAADGLEIDRNASLILPGQAIEEERVVKAK